MRVANARHQGGHAVYQVEAAISATRNLEGPAMSPTFAPRLVITSPDTFVASVPHLLGFTPTESVVIAGVGQVSSRNEVTLVQRFDLPLNGTTSDDLAQIARSAVAPIARTGAHEAIITLVSDQAPGSPEELPHRDLVDRLVEAFDDAGITTRDSLYTDGTSRWSYGCFDPACCPPTGRVIPQDVRTHVAAEFAAAGVAVAGSRDALVTELAATAPDHVSSVAGHLENMAHPGAGIERWRDQEISHINHVLTSSDTLRSEDCARVIEGLDDIRVRDTVLWDLAQPDVDSHTVSASLAQVVRTAPEGRVAPAATTLAIQQWTAGDGARANVALDRALADNPDYSLAGLVETSLHSGLPPATWRDLMRSMPRETCRHGQNAPSTVVVDSPPVGVESPSLAR